MTDVLHFTGFIKNVSYTTFVANKQYPHLKIWINDLNPELFYFWKIAQSNLEELVREVLKIKKNCFDGKLLFEELNNVDPENLSELDRAVRFFILNRITFSGTVESGGFSQQAFHKRFTLSSIQRLEKLAYILPDIKITNLDYSHLLKSSDKNVFLFLDPPYFTATKSRLYGKRGNLHLNFDRERFSKIMQTCSNSWLITYDDCAEIRENFQFANLYEWEVQYGMNNYKQNSAAKGKELFIANYTIPPLSNKNCFKPAQQLNLF
jgi:DNA adenine methylase